MDEDNAVGYETLICCGLNESHHSCIIRRQVQCLDGCGASRNFPHHCIWSTFVGRTDGYCGPCKNPARVKEWKGTSLSHNLFHSPIQKIHRENLNYHGILLTPKQETFANPSSLAGQSTRTLNNVPTNLPTTSPHSFTHRKTKKANRTRRDFSLHI